MNNDNFFYNTSNLNNNKTQNQMPNQMTNTTSPINNNLNNINSIQTQSQINNNIKTNNSTNLQFNNQFDKTNLPNVNNSEINHFRQPTINNTFNQMNNNTNFQNNNSNIVPAASQQTNNTNQRIHTNFQNNNINLTPQQNIEYPNQTITNNSSINDGELLKAFIGKNYEKITTRPFNFSGFFFTTFYMFYRKMFLYGILLFLINLVVLNVIKNSTITMLFNVAVGVFVNKIYLYYANKKIAKIKLQNPQKDINELKELCSTKGGTSVGKIFLGFFAELGITFVILIIMLIAGIGGMVGSLFNPDNWNITINDNNTNTNENTNSTQNNNNDSNNSNNADSTQNNNNDSNNTNSTKNGTLIEDIIINGYSCIGEECNVYIEKSNNETEYKFEANNVDLFKILDDYSDYIKVNIYYIQNGNTKSIVNYEVFTKNNNENISNVKNEEELRKKLGLYTIGTHTDSLTLYKIGRTGAGFNDNTAFTYTNYTFVDKNKNQYKMKYINSNGTLNLTEGNQYNVTFEVIEETFGYEFYIKNVE